MNFILYVHDTSDTPVWDPTVLGVQGAADAVAAEIGELVEAYTMGRVTVDVESDIVPATTRPDGHNFQVMCASCLSEPFDVEDITGPCPEHDEDACDDCGRTDGTHDFTIEH